MDFLVKVQDQHFGLIRIVVPAADKAEAERKAYESIRDFHPQEAQAGDAQRVEILSDAVW